jgi:hypothetical protein
MVGEWEVATAPRILAIIRPAATCNSVANNS